MASSPLTSSRLSSFFVSALQLSQTCFSAATSGSSFRPRGVFRRGNSIRSTACRASSQVCVSRRAAKPRAAVRNFSP